MAKYLKDVNIMYFYKGKKTNIEEVDIGTVVFLEVKNPLNYGLKTLQYYGKIVHKTRCFFDIIEYCNCIWNTNYWYADEIAKKEKRNLSKRWMKKSIIELYTVSTETKIETHEFEMD